MRLAFPLFLLLFAACGDGGIPDAADPAEDEVFDFMASRSLTTVADAFEHLDEFSYTTQLTLEEFDADGRVRSSESRTVRRTPTADGVQESVLGANSTGTSLASNPLGALSRPVNPLFAVIADEPAYASRRTRDRYAYEMRADTTLLGRGVQIVQATLHDESADEQPIRYARYFINTSGEIVGVDVQRQTESALFDEKTHVTVFLQPGPDGSLLPADSFSETIIRTPTNAPKRLRMTQSVRDIDAVE